MIYKLILYRYYKSGKIYLYFIIQIKCPIHIIRPYQYYRRYKLYNK